VRRKEEGKSRGGEDGWKKSLKVEGYYP